MGKIIDNNSTVSTEVKKEINPLLQMGGRPCRYCSDKVKYQTIAENFYLKHREGAKPSIPFLEDLCLELGIDEDTMSLWANKKLKGTKELEHPAFFGVYSNLKLLQKSALKKRTLGRFNPRGAMFLLAADHHVVEESKQILAGDTKEPLEIIITEEQKHDE